MSLTEAPHFIVSMAERVRKVNVGSAIETIVYTPMDRLADWVDACIFGGPDDTDVLRALRDNEQHLYFQETGKPGLPKLNLPSKK